MASATGQDDPVGEHNNQKPILHVREDSASELEALFDILKPAPQKHLQVPLRMRNLPESFWKPPTFGSKSPSVHSRENSLDNSLGQGPFSPGPIPSPGPPSISSPSVHSRELGAGVQVQWKEQELEYLRLLATNILQSDSKTITSTEAMHLTTRVGQNGGKKLNMDDAEGTINKLIKAKWIKDLEDGSEIALDVRFLGEMESWMVEVVGGVAKCQLCRRVVVRGVYCECEEGIAWHKYCLDKKEKAGIETKCKKCGDTIRAVEGGNKRPAEEERGEPSKGARRSKNEDMEEGEEEEESQSQVVKTRTRRSSGEIPKPSPRGRRGKRRKSGDDTDSE